MERPFIDLRSAVETADGVLEMTLPSRPESSRTARAYVQQRFPNLAEPVLSDLEVIVTELVTNAVRHGDPVIRLRLRAEPFAIDVAVLDGSDIVPPTTVTAPSLDSDSGRGLAIVEALSEKWGVEPLRGQPGKAVWASVRNDSSS